VKLELCPEDMLFEYVENRLNGKFNAVVHHEQYIGHLPSSIEFSEEFARRWQTMIAPAMRRFIAETFWLRSFIFSVDGYTKRFSPADAPFWDSVELCFSHRGAERMYEEFLSAHNNEKPLYPVVLPADALLVSVCANDYSLYSFAWMLKNRANWLIMACYVAWQKVSLTAVSWQCLFESPAAVELPLREYLIERAADYLAAVNLCVQALHPAFKAEHTPRPIVGMPLSLIAANTGVPALHKYVESFVAKVRSAVEFWCSEGSAGIDDERYIVGAMKTSGFDSEYAAFSKAAEAILEKMTTEEQIYESLIRN